MKGKYDDIDNYDSSFHGYYIIKFSSSPYTLQEDLSIDRQVISSGEMVCKGTYFFPININHHYHSLQGTKYINTILSLKTIINVNVNVICYDSKDVVLTCLRSISNNYYNDFSPLHFPIK